jgi:adiponectin receptor
MIAGSTTSVFYYGFYCEQVAFWRNLWMGLVWVCCLFALAISLFPSSKRPWLNALVWIIAGYSSTPGFFHLAYYSDKRYVFDFDGRPWFIGGAIYAIGAIIYALKIPERYVKVKFDIVGASHQLFHFAVLIAASIHFWGTMEIYN